LGDGGGQNRLDHEGLPTPQPMLEWQFLEKPVKNLLCGSQIRSDDLSCGFRLFPVSDGSESAQPGESSECRPALKYIKPQPGVRHQWKTTIAH
jgi:hypothetical protein